MTLAQLSGTQLGDSTLQSGDLIEVTTLSGLPEEEPKPQLVRVDQRGVAKVPLIGEVPVAGIDEQQAAARIESAAVERQIFVQPQVTVKVAERAVNQVTVLGAVTNPGTHSLPKGASHVLAALAAAGGLTDEAGTEVEVMRGRNTYYAASEQPPTNGVQPVSFDAPQLAPQALPQGDTSVIDLAQADPNSPQQFDLSDQDVVMVRPVKKRNIHVLGLVRKPDQFELPVDQDIHVLDAIAMAGGKSSPVADKVYVIRRVPDREEPARIQVSLSRAKQSGEENLRLAAGDVVSVEATASTTVVDTLSSVVRVTAGVGSNLLAF